MTICPIAASIGCRKCFAFNFCLVKTVLGDYHKELERADVKPAEKDHSTEAEPKDAPDHEV